MGEQDVLTTVRTLMGADLSVCDRDELAVLVRLMGATRAWIDALEIRVAARATELAAAGACESAATLLEGGGRRSARQADTAARRAKVCAQLPALAQALTAGRISGEHVDAVASVARTLNESGQAELRDLDETLATSAAVSTVDEFARECRDLGRILSRDEGVSRHAQLRQQRQVRRWVDRQTGMHNTLISLDPEADAKVWTAINGAVGKARADKQDPDVSWDHLQADTVVDLITGARATDPRCPEVSVLIDIETLRDGLHVDMVCETSDGIPVPPDAVRRMACDAEIVPVVLGDDGEALDVGRGKRLATRAQRRALNSMYSTCGFPGCTVAFDACRIHHVIPWEHGGPTDLDNLLPLCEREHHHLVHEGHWQLALQADRTVTIHRPDGTLFYEGITTNRKPRHQAA